MPATVKQQIGRLVPHRAKFEARRWLNRGNATTCPLCDSRVARYTAHGGYAPISDELEIVGGMLRENDQCPVCHAKDRTRLVWLHLKQHLDGLAGRPAVLHFAPEVGLFLKLTRQRDIDYRVCDFSPERYSFARGIEQADATKLRYRDASFDVVIASHVLEHIPQDDAAFAEFHRVLKPGGVALLMVPMSHTLETTREDPRISSDADRLRVFGQEDHIRVYAHQDFIDRVRAAGFDVEVVDGSSLGPERVATYHLNPLERLYVGRKPA